MAMARKHCFSVLLRGVFFLLLLALTASSPQAAPPPEDEPGWSTLDLAPEQLRLLRDLRGQFTTEERGIRKKMMHKRMELMTLSPEDFKGEKGEDLRRQIQSLLLQARDRVLFYQQEALNVLTPEQKKRLPPDFDLGFRCRGWFHQGGHSGMGMGMGKGRPRNDGPFN
jgi:Spy/CpxP family protein refolding chaperone